jgi:hypothetical protein
LPARGRPALAIESTESNHARPESARVARDGLGIRTVAEFAESDAILAELHELGVDYAPELRHRARVLLRDCVT